MTHMLPALSTLTRLTALRVGVGIPEAVLEIAGQFGVAVETSECMMKRPSNHVMQRV